MKGVMKSLRNDPALKQRRWDMRHFAQNIRKHNPSTPPLNIRGGYPLNTRMNLIYQCISNLCNRSLIRVIRDFWTLLEISKTS